MEIKVSSILWNVSSRIAILLGRCSERAFFFNVMRNACCASVTIFMTFSLPRCFTVVALSISFMIAGYPRHLWGNHYLKSGISLIMHCRWWIIIFTRCWCLCQYVLCSGSTVTLSVCLFFILSWKFACLICLVPNMS